MRRRLLFLTIGILLGVVAMGAAFSVGYLSRDRVLAASPHDQYALLTQAQDYLDQYYIREQPSQQQLEYGAIRGLLAALGDKYTFFVEPPVAQSESNVLAGTYGGIGVQLRRAENGQFLLYPFRDSPAYKAGVRDGDVLLTAAGKPVTIDLQQDAVDQMMRGEVKDNNGITLTVRHQPSGQEETLTIPFAIIDVPSVTWRVLAEDPTIGYVQIMRFTNRTPDEVKQALTELKAQPLKALVVDMRNNPGGLLDESVKVAGEFMSGGTVFIEKSHDSEKVFTAPDNSALTDLPLVILVNHNTASAAELVAGALRDRGRGILLGQQTYGKGSVQFILPMADKSSIHITTAEWFPPSRTPLDGKGLVLEVPMIPDPNGRDVELGEAIRYLQAKGL